MKPGLISSTFCFYISILFVFHFNFWFPKDLRIIQVHQPRNGHEKWIFLIVLTIILPDTKCHEETKRWSLQPYLSTMLLPEHKPLYRTTSYPLRQRQRQQQHQLQRFSSEPILVPKLLYTSFHPPGSQQASLCNSHHCPLSSLSGGSLP